MVHPGGFEPPTARFVAEYSIQLSYGCIRELLSEIIMVHPGGFEPPTARFVAEYSIQLSYGCKMAVRRGFEPRMQLLTAYSLSRGAPSASRPPHHTTPLSSASSNSLRASRRCVAHILLSGTYKSNNFPKAFIVCTNHTQFACKSRKEGVL